MNITLKKLAAGLVLGLSTLLVAGCGGGGSGSDVTTEPIARAFNGLQYTGALSGDKNGSIELTVKDENGNIVGTVTIDSTVYQATGTLTASGSSRIDFSGAEGQGQITGMASDSAFTGNWSGTVPASAGSSSKGSYQGSVNAGTGSAGSLSLASFSGSYTVHATDDPTPVSFSVDSAGKISTCNADGLKRCSGNMTFNPSDSSASFAISGDDGLSPVDTSVTVSGKVLKDGSVKGNFSFKSVSEGIGSGLIEGIRDGGPPKAIAMPPQKPVEPPKPLPPGEQMTGLVSQGGLTWTANTATPYLWSEARDFCAGLGRRLPTLNEVSELFLSKTPLPGWYLRDIWTSTEFQKGAGSYYAFYIGGPGTTGMGIGYEHAYYFKDSHLYATCVSP